MPQYTYTNIYGPNRRYEVSLTRKTIQNTASEADCCTKCGIWYTATTHMSYNKNSGECACNDMTDGTTSNTNSNGFYAGSCTAPSGRKRRDFNSLVSPRVKRQTIDTTKERKIECVSWLSGTAAYWNYDFKVPSTCYSK